MPGSTIQQLAANLVLLLHFGVVMFAVFGGFAAWIDPRWAWLHVPVVVWSSLVNLAGWTCPLTPLENRFRAAARSETYDGGFIHHYIGPLVYPRGMPRQLEIVAGISIAVWNGLLYGGMLLWPARP